MSALLDDMELGFVERECCMCGIRRRIKCMTRELIIQNIMNNYGKYGITEDMVNEVIDSGLESGANYDMIYLEVMRRITEITGEEFFCTEEDMARAFGVSVDVINRMIEEGRKELIANGENPDEYFVKVPVSKFVM